MLESGINRIKLIVTNLIRLRKFIMDEAVRIIKKDANRIEDYNRQQLFDSADANGVFLGFYSSFTMAEKTRKGRNFGAGIKLIDEGKFYKSIIAEISNEVLTLKTTDSDQNKLSNIFGRFGENILGLNLQNQKIYREKFLKPQLMNSVRNHILR